MSGQCFGYSSIWKSTDDWLLPSYSQVTTYVPVPTRLIFSAGYHTYLLPTYFQSLCCYCLVTAWLCLVGVLLRPGYRAHKLLPDYCSCFYLVTALVTASLLPHYCHTKYLPVNFKLPSFFLFATWQHPGSLEDTGRYTYPFVPITWWQTASNQPDPVSKNYCYYLLRVKIEKTGTELGIVRGIAAAAAWDLNSPGLLQQPEILSKKNMKLLSLKRQCCEIFDLWICSSNSFFWSHWRNSRPIWFGFVPHAIW